MCFGSSSGGTSAAPLAASLDVNQMDNSGPHTEGNNHCTSNRLPTNGEDGEEAVGEVPPPMKPISSIPVQPSELPSGIEKVSFQICKCITNPQLNISIHSISVLKQISVSRKFSVNS